MELKKMWDDLLINQSSEAREKIIIAYLPLVRNIAGRLAVKAPRFMQQEDLENYGVIGLMEAVDKYDPKMGVGFESFAYYRIRGAILDEIRRASWVPRSVWQRQQAIKAAREKIEQTGMSVTENALAEETGLSAKEVRRLNRQVNAAQIYSLDEEINDATGNSMQRTDLLADPYSPDPQNLLDETEEKRILTEAISLLSEREQLLLALYYQEGLTLKEIGEVLEISESRVCQLHGQAIKRLRKIIKQLTDG